jgi:hypothetical protein
MHVPSLQRSLSDVVAEYEHKRAALPAALSAFKAAGDDLKMAATVGGTYGQEQIDTGSVYEHHLESNLLKSAWLHVYDGLDIKRLASPTDKRLFDQAMTSPPEFTIDNIRGTFGRFVQDPRGSILRGLAEVFCGLDQAYKSHDKVKIGVSGLPKRVVLSGFGEYQYYGKQKLETILNALAVYQGKPLVSYRELDELMRDESALLVRAELPATKYAKEIAETPGRGIRLRRFGNGNGHLFFEKDTLKDINKALAEFYGDVLPDTTDEKPTAKRASTAVAKDLQYYPTPTKVVDDVLSDIYPIKGQRVLEPSCGCGRLMDALRKAGANVHGVEVDASRANQARAKGHSVLLANFLETVPTHDFDRVVMNPPFYGKHYAKHVNHALKFLKPGGTLTAILPATARYDHGLLDGRWSDLPIGSFSESGTNINTVVLTKERT